MTVQIFLRFLIVFCVVAGATALAFKKVLDPPAVAAIYGAAMGYATGQIDRGLVEAHQRALETGKNALDTVTGEDSNATD